MLYSGPLFALFPVMETPLTSIKGIIIPASWDTNGTILSTAIVTFDEDIFAVTDSVSLNCDTGTGHGISAGNSGFQICVYNLPGADRQF
jgi:hypothetical protein